MFFIYRREEEEKEEEIQEKKKQEALRGQWFGIGFRWWDKNFSGFGNVTSQCVLAASSGHHFVMSFL